MILTADGTFERLEAPRPERLHIVTYLLGYRFASKDPLDGAAGL